MEGVETRLKALMLRGLAGDAAAHHELLSALAGYLRGYFGRRMGPAAADLEDLVQETLVSVHVKRQSYDPAQPLTPWIYAMARYRLLDHFRRTRRRISVPLEQASALFAQETADEGVARNDLGRLLAQLPPRQRKLIEDVKLKGLSIEEAAAASGMTPAAVKVSIHRGLKGLSEAVRDEDG